MLTFKNKLTKFGLGALGLAIVAMGSYGFANDDSAWKDIESGFGTNQGSVSQIKGVAGTDNVSSKEGSADLLNTIRNAINWILGMLSLIALVVLLWGGFQMVTAAGDENKHKKGFTILKQAAMGLIFIGLSWLIVSLIFWLITTMTQTK